MKYVAFAALTAIVVTACENSEETCRMAATDITISGTVTYDAFQGGEIEISISEETSWRCGSKDGELRLATPGDRVGALVLDAPGEFEAKVTVTYIESTPPPRLDIAAFHGISDNRARCEAGGYTSVPPKDTHDIKLILESGNCPISI